MKRIIHKTSLHIAGWACIAIGIAGLALPILPGLVLIAAGIYLLSLASEWFGLKIQFFTAKYPELHHHYTRFDTKVSKFIKKAY